MQQLPPVMDSSLSRGVDDAQSTKTHVNREGRALWRAIDDVVLLTQSERMRDDPAWAKVCERIAAGVITQEDWVTLHTRTSGAVGSAAAWSDAPRITYKNEDVSDTPPKASPAVRTAVFVVSLTVCH